MIGTDLIATEVIIEVSAYTKISAAWASVPALFSYNEKEQYLVKEYIEGPTASELAVQGLLTERHFELAFRIHEQFTEHALPVDYFPTNFIYRDETVYYIDYACHPYKAEWDFINCKSISG